MSVTTIYEDACSFIKINFSSSATLMNDKSEIDSNGKYITFASNNPDDSLKVVFEEVPPDQDYSYWYLYVHLVGSYEQDYYPDGVNGGLQFEVVPVSDYYKKYASPSFNRTETSQNYQSYDDGTVRNFDYLSYMGDYVYTDYDENGNPFQASIPELSVRIETNAYGTVLWNLENGPYYAVSQTSEIPLGARTASGAGINLQTGQSIPGYVVKVYSLSDLDYPLIEYEFSSDPRQLTVECLKKECPDGCLPLWDSTFSSKMCICQPGETEQDLDVFPNLDQDSRTWQDIQEIKLFA